MAIDFPNSPTVGQSFTGPNGIIWQWDGVKWTAIPATNPSIGAGNVGRNLLHNPLFNVAQRGNPGWSVSTNYTADRWQMFFSGGTLAVSLGAFPDASRAAIGDESATTYLLANVAGTAGAGDFAFLAQLIEGVSRLSNKTVTVSFWAYATSGTPRLGVGLRQNFGAGGSPSGNVDVAGQSVTLTNSPVRYSLTFTLPSTSGKTFGTTAGTDYTRLSLVFSSGTTNAAAFGNPGVQTAAFVLWGIQLEIGTQATLLEKPDPRYDLSNCQRFYEIGVGRQYGYSAAGSITAYTYSFKVTKRASPSMTFASTYTSNVSATSTVDLAAIDMFSAYRTAIATGNTSFQDNWTASADL